MTQQMPLEATPAVATEAGMVYESPTVAIARTVRRVARSWWRGWVRYASSIAPWR